jgi:pimeloyl-ACP methyl ester carboxylesterase
MATIRANGLDIGYEVLGEGPPLVILHGAGTTARYTFAAQLASLTSTFRVFLPDARGHGATRWDTRDGFEAGWLVEDLAAFVDALALPTFHLLAYSMGAMTALGYATADPERLRTLAVVGITTAREPRARVAGRLLDPARIEREEPVWAADLERELGPAQGHGAWRDLLLAIGRDVATQPLLTPADLRTIDAPTLVACGDRDPLVPVVQAAELARQVRDGRLFVAPDAGHDVMNEQPELGTAALEAFYRSTEPIAAVRAGRRPGADPASPPEVPR